MSDYVDVNGAKIERSFLQENIAEANECEWSAGVVAVDENHVHCIVCDVSIPRDAVAFQSDHRWLCKFCMDSFIRCDDL